MKINKTNKKIIDAIVQKAEKVCPDSLVLVGVCGSVATGETYSKSDLDLLVLIRDDAGLELTSQFILNDSQIGYDIYCTRWDDLVDSAQCCNSRQMSKLMDSQIVYVKDKKLYKKFCQLRKKTQKFLQSKEVLKNVEESLKNAKIFYANSNIHEQLGLVRLDAFNAIEALLNAVMLYHHTYFKKGIKKTIEELKRQNIKQDFINNMLKVSSGHNVSEIRNCIRNMIVYVEKLTQSEKQKITNIKKVSSQLSGTYEEMYSNWKNKMHEAAENYDAFSSFMNICASTEMLHEISADIDIGKFDVVDKYNPNDLMGNARLYDKTLEKYKKIYKKFRVKVNEFENVDEFIKDYVKEI